MLQPFDIDVEVVFSKACHQSGVNDIGAWMQTVQVSTPEQARVQGASPSGTTVYCIASGGDDQDLSLLVLEDLEQVETPSGKQAPRLLRELASARTLAHTSALTAVEVCELEDQAHCQPQQSDSGLMSVQIVTSGYDQKVTLWGIEYSTGTGNHSGENEGDCAQFSTVGDQKSRLIQRQLRLEIRRLRSTRTHIPDVSALYICKGSGGNANYRNDSKVEEINRSNEAPISDPTSQRTVFKNDKPRSATKRVLIAGHGMQIVTF
eukprot:CAMPEP_0114530920 /NCGR_PEP_ID=MMETSP0109-20121206/25729_1 /TAXON_ID=29199 /ORGANISM="Chlorarachnion reptans, Strain CCCM449" /LENGTH=262 /DNA_ID=CAMNT_0001713629 /DNA_START=436 /DNA_END=1224 /DNA_ORIENTATION=-